MGRLFLELLPVIVIVLITLVVGSRLSVTVAALQTATEKLGKTTDDLADAGGRLDAAQLELKTVQDKLDAGQLALETAQRELDDTKAKNRSLLEGLSAEETIQYVRKEYKDNTSKQRGRVLLDLGKAQNTRGQKRLAEDLFKAAVSEDANCAAAMIELSILAANSRVPEKQKAVRGYLEQAAKVGDPENKGYALYNLVVHLMATSAGLQDASKYAASLRESTVQQPRGTPELLAKLKAICDANPGVCKE